MLPDERQELENCRESKDLANDIYKKKYRTIKARCDARIRRERGRELSKPVPESRSTQNSAVSQDGRS